MWDLPGPGIEPMSNALAGGFFTTEPPGKSWDCLLFALATACNDLFLCGIICLPFPPPLCWRSHGGRAHAVFTHSVTDQPDLPLSHGFRFLVCQCWNQENPQQIETVVTLPRQAYRKFSITIRPRPSRKGHVEKDCRGIPAEDKFFS